MNMIDQISLKKVMITAMRHWRINNNLRQKDVSDLIHSTHSSYQSYEDGRAEPSIETLLKLCDIYNLPSINAFLFFEDNAYANSVRSDKEKLYGSYMKAGEDKRKIVDFILSSS